MKSQCPFVLVSTTVYLEHLSIARLDNGVYETLATTQKHTSVE